MEKLEHPLWLVEVVNAAAAALLARLGVHVADPARIVPNYLVMCGVVLVAAIAFGLFIRSRLSVENPGRVQIVMEDLVGFVLGMLDDLVGPKGRRYLPLVGAIGLFILVGNLMGLIPGLMAPTSNINVTLGCALTVWFYYHIQGIKELGVVAYFKHFALPPGTPVLMAPLMLVIETISHLSRVLSLSLRLFGNIFGEELVIVILFTIVPFLLPLPMMFLAIITGTLQAFIFVMLTMIYLGAAVAVEEHH